MLKGYIFTFPSCCNCYVWDLDVVNCKMETMDIREHFRRIKQWKIHWKHKEYKKFLFPLAPPRKIVKSWINWSMLSSFFTTIYQFYIPCSELSINRMKSDRIDVNETYSFDWLLILYAINTILLIGRILPKQLW